MAVKSVLTGKVIPVKHRVLVTGKSKYSWDLDLYKNGDNDVFVEKFGIQKWIHHQFEWFIQYTISGQYHVKNNNGCVRHYENKQEAINALRLAFNEYVGELERTM